MKWTRIIHNIYENTKNITISLSGGLDSRLTFLLALKSGINLNNIRVQSFKSDVHTFAEDYRIASEMANCFGFSLNKGHIVTDAINFSLEDILNICIYNKLPFHKEMQYKYQKFKCKLYEIPGFGGESLRSHWDVAPNEHTKTYLKNLQEYDNTEEIRKSVIKIAEDSFTKIRNKYKISDINSRDILRYLYINTRCRNHFGRISVDDYFCNKYYLSPLLDPLLLKLKISTGKCKDNNLLISLIFMRYCPQLLDFKIEGGRFINVQTIEYARSINQKFPVDFFGLESEKYDSHYSIITQSKGVSDIVDLNKNVSKDCINDFLIRVYNNINIKEVITNTFSENIYNKSKEIMKKTKWYPLRSIYFLINVALVNNIINGTDGSYNYLSKIVSENETLRKDMSE